MAQEIERKFLVQSHDYRSVTPTYYKQGYLSTNATSVVRIRIVQESAYVTIKGKNQGATRTEYEYPIPLADAQEILQSLCQKPLIEKYRYVVPFGEVTWEIDEFCGENEGLIVAEVELPHESFQFDLPPWVGMEVTDDVRYYNSNLVKHPYKKWKKHI